MTETEQTAPADTDEEPILDLEEYADPERPVVNFRTKEDKDAGKPSVAFEIRIPEEFGVVEEQEYRSESREYNELRLKQTKLTKSERTKFVMRLEHLFDKVLIAPPEIKRRFSEHQKQAVVTLFTTALLTDDAATVQAALPMIARLQARGELSTTES